MKVLVSVLWCKLYFWTTVYYWKIFFFLNYCRGMCQFMQGKQYPVNPCSLREWKRVTESTNPQVQLTKVSVFQEKSLKGLDFLRMLSSEPFPEIAIRESGMGYEFLPPASHLHKPNFFIQLCCFYLTSANTQLCKFLFPSRTSKYTFSQALLWLLPDSSRAVRGLSGNRPSQTCTSR